MPPTHFRDLTRRQRLYRFRRLAHAALPAYGLVDANLTFLQYGENVIYRVDPAQGRRALLRLHAWDNNRISTQRWSGWMPWLIRAA